MPDALRETADQSSGLMVMSVVEDGPAAQAGIVAGDIILSVDGTSAHRFRKIARHFGADSIGRKADLRLIRSGAVMTVQTTIAERQRRMSEAASKLAPIERLRVAVRAADPPRRIALGRVVAEAGHLVVGVGRTPPTWSWPTATVRRAKPARRQRSAAPMTICPACCRAMPMRDQIDAAIRAVAAGLIVRVPGAREDGFGRDARDATVTPS